MRFNLKYLFIAVLVLAATNTFAQVGIGTNSPAASAALEVTSDNNNKGILIPRITATQKDAISNPAEGLMIFQTTAPVGFYFYTGTAWRLMVTQTDIDVKVDKVSGKALSSNDYTTIEKTKLAAITGSNSGDQDLSALATVASVALKANAADLTNRLALKVDQVNGKELSSNDYTTAEKTKLTVITGTNTGDQTNITGNAATATNLTGLITSVATLNNVSGTNTGDQTLSSLGALASNAAITGTTNTKITYDAKGLVTGGAAATTADIVASAEKNYVTDAQQTVIGNTSNINTGDQTATMVVSVATGTIAAITVQDALNELDIEKAPLTSPGLIGTPRAPTADPGTSTTQIATTAFVAAATAAGSSFVNLTSAQTISGVKNFSSDAIISGITVGVGGGSPLSSVYNTALGLNALVNNTGWGNTAIGRETLTVNANSGNTAVGYKALKLSVNGNNNVAVGSSALAQNTDGNINNAFGSKALGNNVAGSENTAIGSSALSTNTTGNRNTALGNLADVSSIDLTNATAIGYNAKVSASNTIQLGADGTNETTAISNVKTSGTITSGAVTYPNVDGTSGQILTTNGEGTASWQSNATGNVPTFAQSITSMTSPSAIVDSRITIGGLTFQYSLNNGPIGEGKIQISTTSTQEYQAYSKKGEISEHLISTYWSGSDPVDLCSQTLGYYDHLSVDLFRVNSGMGHSFHLDAFVDGWSRLVLRVIYY